MTFSVLGKIYNIAIKVHYITIGAGLVKFLCLSYALDQITGFAINDKLRQSKHISRTFP